MKGLKNIKNRVLSAILAAALVMTGVSFPGAKLEAQAAFEGTLSTADSARAQDNVVAVSFNGGAVEAKITFLENGIFRYNVDPSGKFSEYASVNNDEDLAKIPQYPDTYEAYSHPTATVTDDENYLTISAEDTTIKFEKATAKMTVEYKGKVVMQESAPLSIGSKTTQYLVKNDKENFFGGGTQNGRFIHTNESINIKNESNWVDGGVASPNPFYYTSGGYGVLRNTFLPGVYDFGKTVEDTVTAVHNEKEYDAYIFLSDGGTNTAEVVQDILQGYYHVTGNPVLLPEYGYYEGHLNCYNRDSWSDDGNDTTGWVIKGSSSGTKEDNEPIDTAYSEGGQHSGYVFSEGMGVESLNGTQPGTELDKFPRVDTNVKYSARAVIDSYVKYDMPLGYFLPNDGYGCGYGHNGYYKTGGVNEDGTSSEARTAAIDANVQNLAEFTEYAESKGVATGLWTQSNLNPDSNNNTSWHLLRDFRKEVNVGGISALKTDVAWVGHGYNFAINSIKSAYDIVTEAKKRPNIITLDGWAGTHRYSCVWTGDQYGGNWEYIRFHIPTYIGQSLSGNPNVASDMDGIFGGEKLIATRDTQWKIFSPQMLNMDGWGKFAKTPQTFGDPYTGIARMYLKLKAQLLPYLYTTGASAANMDTGNNDTGLPMVRAMFLEFPEDDYAETKNMQYQYMFGSDFLVAPIYQDTKADEMGNDIRNDIYLPDSNEIWIDYFTGKQYRGGQVLNGFDAPLWKLPVFVRNGAIVPMWEENNSPQFIDKANRIIEFWPEGNTDYTLYEDDGSSITANLKEEEGYGPVNTLDYGNHISTKFTSKVDGTTATLTAERSTGEAYNGYEANKNTTFVVNVSEKPASVAASNGSDALDMVEVSSKEAFESTAADSGKFVYYYDESPAVETYISEKTAVEDEFIAMMADKTTTPKLYVKFASTDSKANAQTLVIEGFKNVDPELGKEDKNSNLEAPTGLADKTDAKTPTSNTITWNAVDGAIGYDVLIDGVVNSVGNVTEFVHDDQSYNSTHTYKVRARNTEGYSEWSTEISATTSLDPWRDVPEIKTIKWEGGEQWGKLSKMTDHIVDGTEHFHSTDQVAGTDKNMILDYGVAYKLDKMEYYPREDLSNGTVSRMDVYTSIDGITWEKHHDGATNNWTYQPGKTASENVKTIAFNGVTARYVRIDIISSVGNFFAANEISIYKEEGSKGFALGSTLGNATVLEGDYSNMKNYLGKTSKDTDWQQIAIGDINGNNYYDVYDYAFTMFNVNGGTSKTGKVEGNVFFLPSKTAVEEGETFTIDVYAQDVENLNAFGHVIKYDQGEAEYVSVSQSLLNIGQMENLSAQKLYNDEANINLAFANKGNQETFSGSGILATITMKAKTAGNVADMMELENITIIGPEFDYKVCNSLVDPTLPDVDTNVGGEYVYGTDFNLTMTNDLLETDEGENVNKLIQNNTYDKLFDNTINRDDFQFKWNIEQNHGKAYPDYITLPTTLTFTLVGDKTIDEVKVYNANTGNGYVTKAEAVFHYAEQDDSEAIAQEIAEPVSYAALTFDNPNPTYKVTSVDITITEAIDGAENPVSHMLTLSEIELYGASYESSAEGEAESTTESNASVLDYTTDFTVTMTNAKITEDTEGSNVVTMTQGGSYDLLFNGDKENRDDFQFKWDTENNYVSTGKLPEYVKLPTTLHVNMTQPKEVSGVNVYNGATGNGYVTSAKAKFNYEGGTSSTEETKTVEVVADTVFEFENPDKTKKVTSVEVTILEANPDGDGVVAVSLAEMEVNYPAIGESVTGITIAEDQVKEIYNGQIVDVKASVVPENAANPYYTVTSSDPSKVRIVTLTDENNRPIYKLYGEEAGTANITVKALELKDGQTPIEATFEVTVKEGVDKTRLIEAIQKYGNLNKKFYTEQTFAVLEEKIANANSVVHNVSAQEAEVVNALDALEQAYGQLVESPLTAALIEDMSKFSVNALYSDNNFPRYVLDGSAQTFWESPYSGNNVGLPKDVTVTFDEPYNLDQVEIIKNSYTNGKVLKYEVLVSSDGEHYSSVGVKDTASTESESHIRLEADNVTHVIVRLLKAMDQDNTDTAGYVRISDVKFYGEKTSDSGNEGGSGDEGGNQTPDGLDYGDIIEEDRVDLPGIPGDIWLKGIEDKDYTGGKITQSFRLYDGNVLLKEGVDYTVSYKNNVNACDPIAEDAAFNSKLPYVSIKMKGNYSGTHNVNFTINRQSLTDGDSVTAESISTKVKTKMPNPVVYWNGKALKANKDFTFTTDGNKDAVGNYTVTITGKGNFTDSITVDYIVTPEQTSINKAKITIKDKKVAWSPDGAEVPYENIIVKVGKVTLNEETDYDVRYVNNKAVGTAYVVIDGTGTYSGSKRAAYKIEGIAMKPVEVSMPEAFPYEGVAIEPIGMDGVTVKIGSDELVEGEHFEAAYKNNNKQGTATITLTGNPEAGYTGTKKVTFKISKAQLTNEMLVQVGDTEITSADQKIEVPFTQGGTKPTVKLETEDGRELVLGTDYTVSYKNNTKRNGEAMLTITGKGNFDSKTKITKGFTIVPKNADSGEITVAVNDKVEAKATAKNGWKSNVKVVDISGKTLVNKKDYSADITYTVISSPDESLAEGTVLNDSIKGVKAGTKIKVEVTLGGTNGNFEGKVEGEYSILAKDHDISKAKITIAPQNYTGKKVELEDKDITIAIKKLKINDLVLGEDYVIVGYTNNIKKGTAKVTLKGIGEYGGTKTVSFKIGQRNIIENLFDWIFG